MKCAVCEKGTILLDRRKIANKQVVCEECFSKAKTLTVKQTFKTKSITIDELKQSIIDSGFEIKKYTPPTAEELEEILNPRMQCPKCSSTDLQFMQNNKKAFSVGKAVGGAVLTGGIGALAGFAGKKGEDQWYCSSCGEIFTTKKRK